MEPITEKVQQKKRKLFLASVLFFIVYFLLIFQQTNLLSSVFQSQLPLTVPKLTTLLFAPDWVSQTIQQAKRGAILVGIVGAIEIIVFFALSLFLLLYFWKMKKLAPWRWNDYLIFIGYLLLIVLSILCAYMVISSTVNTFLTIERRLSVLRPEEIETAINRYQTFIENYTFDVSKLGKDLSVISGELNRVFHEIKQIRDIPKVIKTWLQTLDQWRFHFILSYLLSVALVIIGYMSQQLHLYRWIKNKKSKKDLINERLLTILEQQQQLFQELIERKESRPNETDSISAKDS